MFSEYVVELIQNGTEKCPEKERKHLFKLSYVRGWFHPQYLINSLGQHSMVEIHAHSV